MATARRATAVRVQGTASGRFHLQGREEATADAANVFGNGDFVPLSPERRLRLVYEAEVEFGFTTTADDDRMDQAEVFRFRLWQWSLTPEGAAAEVLLPWQTFQGDDPPGAAYGWDRLLQVAVQRLRWVRYDRQVFETVQVGGL